jgi:hypothetical protein
MIYLYCCGQRTGNFSHIVFLFCVPLVHLSTRRTSYTRKRLTFGAMLLFGPNGNFLEAVVSPPCGVLYTHIQVRLFVEPLLGLRFSFL